MQMSMLRFVAGTVASVSLLMPCVLASAATPASAGSQAEVTRAVANGASLSLLPTALTPALDAVASDAPTGFSCGAKANACKGGNEKASKKIVVFGDSHAAMWFAPLAAGLKAKYSLVLRWRAGCPAAAVTVPSTVLGTGAECNQWRSDTLKQTIAEHPSAVIIAELTSRSYGTQSAVVSSAQWKAALGVTLSALRSGHIATLVIGDNPSFPGPPAACVALHLTSVKSCNGLVHQTDGTENLAAAEQQAATLNHAKFIPTTQLFCTQTLCPPIINNIFVYFDITHMTQTYSIYLSKVITKLTGL